MPLLQWSSSHSILSECRWLGEPELIPKILIICPAGRIRSAHSVSEHARPNEMSPRGAMCWAIGGKPGLLIISNSSLASLQTKCHLVPTGGVWAGSLTRWQSKQQTRSFQQSKYKVNIYHKGIFDWFGGGVSCIFDKYIPFMIWLLLLICTRSILFSDLSIKGCCCQHMKRFGKRRAAMPLQLYKRKK